ncbi:epoxyqueuosine reductase [Geomonas sp. RF6]|uniref:epoxyqueuosine reductase n=1 Tax=Geomonas sp. RF6 TaxID=2897342 RepID=UPI001E2C035A|nr:epoxyqueuosine reductase [Geomonas sp. RF6]UFS72527.1 epoxyqueuosine reductase [Geomonas sp. RF6]
MVQTIARVISDFVKHSSENRLPGTREPFFLDPLIGFAAAADPIFTEYKTIIGEFHQTPQEVLTAAHGSDARAVTVISWVLPISPDIRASNRREKTFPSREWALTRQYGESFNEELRRHVVEWLTRAGYRAVAPQLAPGWKQYKVSPVGFASTWSERHVAYAAGLGTFSLNDGLITSMGIAHRLGSVVTDMIVTPTPRSAPDHRANCLWYRDGSCGACMRRCPVGAITEGGHDKKACFEYVYHAVTEAIGRPYRIEQTGCGLCQTGVPCETCIPEKC